MNTLGEKIMTARKIKGLSLRELGNKIGMSHSQLSRVERGLNNPSNSLLKKIADELDLDMEELLILCDPNSNNLEYPGKLQRIHYKNTDYVKRRYNILLRDNFTCQACGVTAPSAPLEVSNIIPLSLGGNTTIENSITLCSNCHKGRELQISESGLEDDIFVKRFNIDLSDYRDLK
ncbi:transcriptional regulator with XRE-family HTH domain [Lysinibacillus composti]|uniref:Helix-turn-helix domain-containing protein n=1 Tax=Lysinibacillus composti TaxID=720633 RepID=A0A3N9UJI2_9BACI|nr:helix-turn-helix transcriptional regulator [Lysinibacillus composti]MBM7607244.1 transcriptional regulator with XRE-family HTH domain [Lysinibacillus composti]RQW76179.1 helix-turn-helix domain-containing protein [Lysinibacillus composti]